jgi:peptidoglycan L-alanyl-D-glutamate endopeptidase CwlK
METTSLKLLNQLHPLLRAKAIEAYNEAVAATPSHIHPLITETGRSFKRSDDLYAQGRTTKGEIVTNSKAGQSYHNYFLALDFVILVDGLKSWKVDDNWMIVVNIFKKHGFIWGADWDNDGITKAQGDKDEHLVDAPHFEMTFGYNWRKLLEMHNNKDYIAGTNYLDLKIK